MTISEPTPKSSGELDEPVRRFEVYTGAGRRRDWSAEDKARIVSESFEPGARVSAVARRHALRRRTATPTYSSHLFASVFERNKSTCRTRILRYCFNQGAVLALYKGLKCV
jgi:hypothetical protein